MSFATSKLSHGVTSVIPESFVAVNMSTSGISWQQTETAICHSWRPCRQPNCHAFWRPVICCSRTQSME